MSRCGRAPSCGRLGQVGAGAFAAGARQFWGSCGCDAAGASWDGGPAGGAWVGAPAHVRCSGAALHFARGARAHASVIAVFGCANELA
jgi:hypothetical protein